MKTSLRTIELNGAVYTYELNLGGVKNLNMRLKSDGTIRVSAPYHTGIQEIERFIRKYSERILKSKKNLEDKALKPTFPVDFTTGELFMMYGKIYMIETVVSSETKVELRGNILRIEGKNKTDFKKLFEKYRKDELSSVIEPMCLKLEPYFASKGCLTPAFRYKCVKSKWGSCNVKTGEILFSLRLFEVPQYLIYYVVVHEFCHLVVPNHSAEFYRYVTMFMPDYKKRVKLLRQYA